MLHELDKIVSESEQAPEWRSR